MRIYCMGYSSPGKMERHVLILWVNNRHQKEKESKNYESEGGQPASFLLSVS